MGRFHVVWAEQWGNLVLQLQTLSTAKVFAVLPTKLQWAEYERVDQGAIARECSISAASVSRAMSELERLGAIERQGKGAYTTWRLSLSWGYRGTVAQFAAEREKRAAEQAALKAEIDNEAAIDAGMLEAIEAAEAEMQEAERIALQRAADSAPKPGPQRALRLLQAVGTK